MAVMCIVIAIIGFNLWPFFGKGFFYRALAVHFIWTYALCYRLALRMSTVDVFCSKAVLIGVVLSFSNLIDECYFDPKKIEINEYFALFVIVLIMALPRILWARYLKRS